MNKLSHQELTDLVYDRISTNPRYEWVQKNVEYSVILPWLHSGLDLHRVIEGEWDVIAKVKDKELYTYFECKTNRHFKADNKALEQFKRTLLAYPEVKWNFVEVCNNYVKRVYL